MREKIDQPIFNYFQEGKTIDEVIALTTYSRSKVKLYWSVYQEFKKSHSIITQRHVDILGCIELGLSDLKISKVMSCSPGTVAKFRIKYELLKIESPEKSYHDKISTNIKDKLDELSLYSLEHNKNLVHTKDQKKLIILSCIELGVSNAQISRLLHCSPNTAAKFKNEFCKEKEINPDISYLSQLNDQLKQQVLDMIESHMVATIPDSKKALMQQIYELKLENLSQKDIAEQLGLSQSRISILLKQFYDYKLKTLEQDVDLISKVGALYKKRMSAYNIGKQLQLTSEIVDAAIQIYAKQEAEKQIGEFVIKDELQKKAIELYIAGMSQTEIAQKLGKSKPSISYYLKPYKAYVKNKQLISSEVITIESLQDLPMASLENSEAKPEIPISESTEIEKSLPDNVMSTESEIVLTSPVSTIEEGMDITLPLQENQSIEKSMEDTITPNAALIHMAAENTTETQYTEKISVAQEERPRTLKDFLPASKLRIRSVEGDVAVYQCESDAVYISKTTNHEVEYIHVAITELDTFIEELQELNAYLKRELS